MPHPTDMEALNRHLHRLSQQTRAAIDGKRWEEAKMLIFQVLDAVPDLPVAWADLAFVEVRLGNDRQAHEYALYAIKTCSGTTADSYVYSTACETAAQLHRFEEALCYAREAVRLRDASANRISALPLPQGNPPGLSRDRRRNIISYSLFGSNPRYGETAVINSKLAHTVYPEWTCRFYVDDSVPADVIRRLRANGAQVVYVRNGWQNIPGLFWRFAVADDPDVQCFIVRDADSLLSNKERAAVDEWLASGRWFHLMRDDVTHCELILAGMWGGYGGVLGNMQTAITQHLARLLKLNRTIDQVFLREEIWPTVSQSVWAHDKCRLMSDTHPFPAYPLSEIEKIPYFHIGMIDANARTTTVTVAQDNAERVRWYLAQADGTIVCRYECDVPPDGKLTLQLPYSYSMKLDAGEWQIYTQRLD
ncbi:Uncharacterised protein [Neisseria animalis]|nr:Uncharacterised protein [Neisseria animalis]